VGILLDRLRNHNDALWNRAAFRSFFISFPQIPLWNFFVAVRAAANDYLPSRQSSFPYPFGSKFNSRVLLAAAEGLLEAIPS
jgi:hypothetical protein